MNTSMRYGHAMRNRRIAGYLSSNEGGVAIFDRQLVERAQNGEPKLYGVCF